MHSLPQQESGISVFFLVTFTVFDLEQSFNLGNSKVDGVALSLPILIFSDYYVLTSESIFFSGCHIDLIKLPSPVLRGHSPPLCIKKDSAHFHYFPFIRHVVCYLRFSFDMYNQGLK